MGEFVTNRKRIPTLDYIKGFGIILIAIYHIVYRSMDGIPDKMIRSLGWAYIGIFFLLSGFTGRQESGIKESYRRRVKGLLLPVVLMELLLLFLGGIYCMIFHKYSISDVIHDSLVTFLRPEITTRIAARSAAAWGDGGTLFFNLSPVWFIWTMVWTELFFHPLRHLVMGRGTKAWIALQVVLLGIQVPMYVFLKPAPWGLTVLPTYLMFMMIGVKLREWNVLERLDRLRLSRAIPISIACLAAHFGLFLFNGNESYYVSKFGNRGALDVFTVILQVVIIFPALYTLARCVGKFRWPALVLEWYGKHTLTVLLMHCLIALVYSDLLGVYCKPGSLWYLELADIPLTFEIIAKSSLSCLLALLTCIPMTILWEKLERVAFRKKPKKKQTDSGRGEAPGKKK